MEAQTVDTLPVAADHDPVRRLLAIELSKKSWIVAIATALSDKISRYTLDGCDWKGLLELMERVRMRVAREVAVFVGMSQRCQLRKQLPLALQSLPLIVNY